MSQQIDQLFRESLREGALPVREELWGRLEPFLPEPKKRDRGFIFWLTGLGVVLLAVFILWFAQRDSSNNYPKVSNTPQNAAFAIAPDTESNVQLSDKSSEQNQLVELAASAYEPGYTAPAVSVADKKPIHNASYNSYNNTDRSQSGITTETLVAENAGAQSISVVETSETAGANTVNNVSQRKAMPFLMLATPVALGHDMRALPDPAKDCYDFGGKRKSGTGGWFVEAYTGPTLSMKKLSSKGEDVSTYILGRDTSESSRVSWHAGLRAGYLTGSGISIRVGAHYTAVNEKFDYYDGMYSQTTIVADTIWDPQGNPIDIEFDTVIVTGQRFKTTYNHYHTVDIPLLIGYQVSNNNWTFGIQAGPMFNILFKKKGDILSPVTNEPASFSDEADPAYSPVFKDRLGMSIYAGAHIGKRIGYRTTVYLEPHMQMRLKSITLDQYPVEQKQTNVGLSVGLRYTLN